MQKQIQKKMNTHAVVTLAVGARCRSIVEITGESMRAYAEKVQAEFVVLDSERVRCGEPKFEKLQLYDLLSIYDRILFVDADALIMPLCPNLFDLVPIGLFGAFFDSNGGNGDAENGLPPIREEEMASYQKIQADIGWKKDYFNSGVMVLSKAHQQLFKYPEGVVRSQRFVDQTFLNYRLQKSGCPWMDIGQRFNHFMALNRSPRMWDSRFESNIIHYAGFSEFYSEQSMTDIISADFNRVFNVSRASRRRMA